MGKKILESNNYDLFELTEFNRDVVRTKRLEKSFMKHGWIDACPLHVVRNGSGKLRIKQGHHRFEAAKALGMMVKYVECEDDASIFELEASTKRWAVKDYLVAFCRTGNKEYMHLKDYCDESGITPGLAISLMAGNMASGHSTCQTKFKLGTYVVNKDSDHANIVKDIVLCMQRNGVEFASTGLIVSAISKIVFVPQFDVEKMKKKIKLFSPMIKKKPNLEEYLLMLEDLYNYKSGKKIPLKFLAIEEARKRKEALFLPKKVPVKTDKRRQAQISAMR